MKKGLTSSEASERLKKFGLNELPSSKPKTVWRIALEVLKEPMFLLLISCGVLYMILGDFKEGIILISTMSIIIFITFFQHRKTEKALEALKKLSSPRALVIRDGEEVRIPGREVVPGDHVIIAEGDRIPADGTLYDGLNIQVDESIITGESLPVDKLANAENNSVLSGTLVTKGYGIILIEKTGSSTEFGKIGHSLNEIKDDETRLQTEMKRLIRRLAIVGIILCVSVVALFYITRGNFIQSLLNGLSSAMAILPEEFPVILTVFLALGSWRLSKKNVLSRKASAIETLGSATVLCSDKTGTITQNKMILSVVLNDTRLFSEKDLKEVDPGLSEIMTCSYLACHPESADPMEKAIIQAYKNRPDSPVDHQLQKEYPFSHEVLAMTRVYTRDQADISFAFTKGAPEALFKLCRLSDEVIAELTEQVKSIASKGMRVLAVGKATVPTTELPEQQTGFQFEFMGLLGFVDPIRPEVPQAISECKQAGIKVIMITGDFPETALNIGKQIGLDSGTLMTGDELNALTDEELKSNIEKVSILARVKPEQKLRIVDALKQNNEIVAMTGDGVNDAPALKAAHIGIAMGKKGTDVAREASSLVLLDDNFASIVSAIRMGRKIYDNLQKAMSYVLAIHIPIIGLTLLPAFFIGSPLILMPLHIVFMELIIDPISSVAFESEDEERGIMERPPRDPEKQFFGSQKILSSFLQGLLVLITVLVVFFITHQDGHSDNEVRAISFTTLLIGNLFLILSKLSTTRSFLSIVLSKNTAAKLIILMAAGILTLILIVPDMANLFSFEFPGFYHLFISLGAALVMLMILETIKFIRKRKLDNPTE